MTEIIPPEDTSEEGVDEVLPDIDSTEGISEAVLVHYQRVAKRMYMFPSALLKDLNQLIDSQTVTSAAKLRDIVRDRYKGTLKIPSLTVFRGYVVVRQHQKKKLDDAKQAFTEEVDIQSTTSDISQKSQSIYQDLTLSVENKKTLLENLIKLCDKRIDAIKILQEDDPSSSYEAALNSYIREMRALTETLIKLRNELKTEGEQELDNYIEDKLASILKATVQAYASVHGNNHLDAFRSALKLKLKEHNLPLDSKVE